MIVVSSYQYLAVDVSAMTNLRRRCFELNSFELNSIGLYSYILFEQKNAVRMVQSRPSQVD